MSTGGLAFPRPCGVLFMSFASVLPGGCASRHFGGESQTERKAAANPRVDSLCDSWKSSKVPPPSVLPMTLEARARCWKNVIVPRLIAEHGPGIAAADSCADFTQLWLTKLRPLGYVLRYAQTQGSGKVKVDGSTKILDKTHVVVADLGLCKGDGVSCSDEILIDPTYTQFLEKGECRHSPRPEDCSVIPTLVAAAPLVFAGTRAQAFEHYTRLGRYL